MNKEPFNQQKYINDFKKEKYDIISVSVPKGEREVFKKFAKEQNISLAQLIRTAIFEKIDREK